MGNSNEIKETFVKKCCNKVRVTGLKRLYLSIYLYIAKYIAKVLGISH